MVKVYRTLNRPMEDPAMCHIHEKEALANLPADELQASLTAFMAPVLTHLPEQRLRQVEPAHGARHLGRPIASPDGDNAGRPA